MNPGNRILPNKAKMRLAVAIIKESLRMSWRRLLNRPSSLICKECGQIYIDRPKDDTGFCSGVCHGDYEFRKIHDSISDTY